MWNYVKDQVFPKASEGLEATECFCVAVLVTIEDEKGNRIVTEACYTVRESAINPKYGDNWFRIEPPPEDLFVVNQVGKFTMSGGDWDKEFLYPDFVAYGMGYVEDKDRPNKIIAWMYPPEPARG